MLCSYQGCEVGVKIGVGVDRSRAFWLESELESVKIFQLRLLPGVAGCDPSTDDNFGRTVMHRHRNIEGREERRAAVWRYSRSVI